MSNMSLTAVAVLTTLLLGFNTVGDKKDTSKPPILDKNVVDIVGFYHVKGDDYNGLLQISKPEGTQVYLLNQLVNGQSLKGLGVLKGKVLSVSWTGQGIQAAVSVMDFSGSVAKGVWASVPSNGQHINETWRLIKLNDD